MSVAIDRHAVDSVYCNVKILGGDGIWTDLTIFTVISKKYILMAKHFCDEDEEIYWVGILCTL